MGLEELLEQGSNPINDVKMGLRVKDVIKTNTQWYEDAIANLKRKDMDPAISPPMMTPEANEIVDRGNLNAQHILGVKQAIKENIISQFGAAPTNAAVLKANSNKKILVYTR